MAISNEAKTEYVKAINAIWSGSMSGNTEANINDEVVRLVDLALDEIANCSKQFAVIHVIYSVFYSAPTSWAALLVSVGMSSTDVADWINVLKGNLQYRACVNAAAVNYKSGVQMALWGI